LRRLNSTQGEQTLSILPTENCDILSKNRLQSHKISH